MLSRKTVNLNRDLYTITSAKAAFYKFRKRYAAEISLDDSLISVIFKFPDSLSSEEQEQILVDFQHELVDCSLRENIAKDTEIVRNLILANAFSNATVDESDD